MEILKLPRDATFTNTQEEPFIGTNVSVAQYEAWSRHKRLEYQTEPEKVNSRWIERKLQELHAAWIMVIDGQVVASGSLTDYPSDEEFDAFCEKFGKFPFVFLSPRVLMIEENISWHKTLEDGDAYPTVPVAVKGTAGHVEIHADFDTGAIGVHFDQELLLRHKVMTWRDHDIEKVSQHLGQNFRYIQRPLWLEVTDKHGMCQRVGMIALCIENWQSSPFVAINPQRTALVGREIFLKLRPVVHLDFAARQTEIEYEMMKGG
ncbi:MAG: hypothetical protein ONB44_12240 [candidate division KSB1 bacterium]|nr:hypothetical protein [candidate division KSB1 bacterium]MDZ7302890.1 hypothetical protein [candidate division KSB1 bacterium]MDZ7310465.1 hypothetical protein [candidate division KSB1 bacterium]